TSKNQQDARRASTDVKRIINELLVENVEGMVLDLRNNGGGSLREAIDAAGLFISSGPIVQVKERNGIQVLPDVDPETNYDGPLIVLVNRLSASASEILAAALQDYGRAVVVGDHKTHGKGTVQSVYPLSKVSDNLGSLKVTTASFYRIEGGSTQLRGVTPDVILPSLFDTLEIGEEFLPNALPWSKVNSAYFRLWTPSVKPLLPELQKRSAARMEDNPAFTDFMARRERISERMETPEISLKLSDRVEEILAEQELDDLQNDPLAKKDTDDEEDEEEQDDPILDETLLILSDMIELSQPDQLTQKTN
ncbi:MAG: carboxy terminal-processing peptidase, partial [Victivallales bacterium]|nr:carboxy terminal-processing peptidase [Victivallales bacterium]